MAGFCPNCGTPATDDAVFCRGCGVKIVDAIAAALGNRASVPATNETAPPPPAMPSAGAEQPVSQTEPGAMGSSGSITPDKSGGCAKEIIIIVLVFALLAVAGVGIAIYLAH